MGIKFESRGDASALIPRALAQPPFASLGWTFPGASSSTPLVSIREKRTGTQFAGEFCYRSGQSECPRLTGAGTRTKKVAGIKSLDIYALAFYVDEPAARSHLHHRYTNKTAEQIAKDPQLFAELSKATSIEKSLVLVITSGLVKRKNFLEALEERLEPPMTKANENAALQAFKQQFDNVTFRKGLKITFTFTGGKLVTKADGKELQTLSNKTLAEVLLDIYTGGNPVSPAAKKAFATGLARMVLS